MCLQPLKGCSTWHARSLQRWHAKCNVNRPQQSKRADLLLGYWQVTPQYLPRGLIKSLPCPQQQGDVVCTHRNALWGEHRSILLWFVHTTFLVLSFCEASKANTAAISNKTMQKCNPPRSSHPHAYQHTHKTASQKRKKTSLQHQLQPISNS